MSFEISRWTHEFQVSPTLWTKYSNRKRPSSPGTAQKVLSYVRSTVVTCTVISGHRLKMPWTPAICHLNVRSWNFLAEVAVHPRTMLQPPKVRGYPVWFVVLTRVMPCRSGKETTSWFNTISGEQFQQPWYDAHCHEGSGGQEHVNKLDALW